MSKQYKGWEIAKLIGEGKLKEGTLLKRVDWGFRKNFEVRGHHLEFEGEGKELGSSYLSTREGLYEIVPKSVNFMEIVNSKMQCRVEYEKYEIYTNYFSLNDILRFLTEKEFNIKEIIKEGKWYIEESEDDSNE